MAGMKRFVTYIYAYEDGRKGSNIGFAKVEIRGEDCRIELHLRGIYARQSACRVYLFRVDAKDIEGIQIGEIKLTNGNGSLGVNLKAGRIGETPFGMEDMEGIFLLSEDDRIFMSRWKEGAPLEVCRERFREWRPETKTPLTGGGEMRPKPVEVQNTRAAEIKGALPEGQNARPAEAEGTFPERQNVQGAGAEICGEDMQATEIPMRNIFPGYDWREIWEDLRQKHPMYRPFEDRGAVCIQLELKDLRELPKRYWYLGNNSFLLHGFFNYRYLVVGRTGDERWFIGVPGIYQRQERVMAAIFGFPEFITATVPGQEEAGGEPMNRFGCWYRYIEE
ncbi:MAG: DUF6128 domain-containing protein [Roseburia sp.]